MKSKAYEIMKQIGDEIESDEPNLSTILTTANKLADELNKHQGKINSVIDQSHLIKMARTYIKLAASQIMSVSKDFDNPLQILSRALRYGELSEDPDVQTLIAYASKYALLMYQAELQASLERGPMWVVAPEQTQEDLPNSIPPVLQLGELPVTSSQSDPSPSADQHDQHPDSDPLPQA